MTTRILLVDDHPMIRSAVAMLLGGSEFTVAGSAGSAGSAITAIGEIDPDQPLYDVRPMTAVLERTLHGQWLNMILVGAFAAMALLLASTGLFGVVSYLTEQRQREFGIRVAVGARAVDVLALVLKQGLARAAVGLALGLALSAALTRALGAMLQRDGVVRADPAASPLPGWSPPDGRPHHAPKTKSVIWIFLSGGVSHLETWDPKPTLNRYAGKTYDATGLPSPFKSPLFRERSREARGQVLHDHDRARLVDP